MFDLIGFDGDDTLWHNERLYQMGRQRFRQVLLKYGLRESEAEIDDRVHDTEMRNLPHYGYGVMSFVLSLIETSIELTGGRITGEDISELLGLSREMLNAEVHLFEGVGETLSRLSGDYALMLITKGDLQHQQSKVDRSGLKRYFRHVEVVSEKSRDTYAALLSRHDAHPSRFLMVGNSMRSDVLPVLGLGGWAVHIPALISWAHEDVEPLGNLGNKFFELESLSQLPDLLGTLREKKNA
jgi:putative hydrolase of the HAD superfamily